MRYEVLGVAFEGKSDLAFRMFLRLAAAEVTWENCRGTIILGRAF